MISQDKCLHWINSDALCQIIGPPETSENGKEGREDTFRRPEGIQVWIFGSSCANSEKKDAICYRGMLMRH